jgi:hypothetical protein
LRKFIINILWVAQSFLLGQSVLLDDLVELSPPSSMVKDIFKGTRIINLQSVELPNPGVFQFIIAHRFGAVNQGLYTLFGLDEAEIRFDFQYGQNEKIAYGFGRNSYEKTYEIFTKVRLRHQKMGKQRFPVSVVYYTSVFIDTEETGPTMENYFQNRLSYVHQFIVGKKISKYFSFEVAPTFLHRNFVNQSTDFNDTYAIGLGGRLKINNWVTFNGEYCLRVGDFSKDFNNSLSIGFDLETGGHVFQFHVTNSQGMFERAYISETRGEWKTGVLYFGFNLSRSFQLKISN